MLSAVIADYIERRRRQRLLATISGQPVGLIDNEPMIRYLQTTPPSWGAHAERCEYLVVDLETTGLSVQRDSLLSMGYLPIIDGQIRLRDAQHTLLAGAAPVGQSATIHGIHDHQLVGGETLETVMSEFLLALAGRVLVVHFSRLDIGFLNKTCRQLYGVGLLAPILDTMAVERRYRYRDKHDHEMPSLSLDECRARYGLPRYRAHNASTDALATAELWLAQMSYGQKDGSATLRHFR